MPLDKTGPGAASPLLRRVARLAPLLREFVASDAKAVWLRGQLRWQVFRWRNRREDRINRAFDARHGVETAMEIQLGDAGVPATDTARGNGIYRPLWESEFHRIISRAGIDYGKFTFVDIGSGKGKLLLLASDYPFKAITGVEYAPVLHEAALRNIARYRAPSQKCFDLSASLGDATEYRLPDGPVLCFIFNAMDTGTTAAALRNIAQQASEPPRPLRVVYANLRDVEEIGGALDRIPGLRAIGRHRTHVTLSNGL